MKTILTLSFCLVAFWAMGQVHAERSANANEPKKPFKYIVMFREETNGMAMTEPGVITFTAKGWETKVVGFYTKDSMLKWLNEGSVYYYGNDDRHDAKLNQITFISAYNLESMERIKIEFKTEKKSRPKEVVIEADEWENTFWEIKN